MDNKEYTCIEQYLQSQKASLFDDDVTNARIMHERNPYRIKKLGSKVRNFSSDKLKTQCKVLARKAVYAKFSQNRALKEILIKTGERKIVEASPDPIWGCGLHLRDRNALN